MWELPPDLPGADDHALRPVFVSPGGDTSEQRLDTSASVRGECRCGWGSARTFAVPLLAAATDQRASNVADIDTHVETLLRDELRPEWWRQHLLDAVALLELRQAAPATRIADPALADAVASAWVAGASWTDIGEAVGIARQAAWKRWRHTVRPGPPRAAAPTADGRERNTGLPTPAGWPGRPGWTHPSPEHAAEHTPFAYSVDLAGRERDRVRADAAYLGPACSCGWYGPTVAIPDVPARGLAETLGRLADRTLATAWNRHLHAALPTLRIKKSLQFSAEEVGYLDGLVARAHERGASWAQIGGELGMSAQAAWERWHRATTAADATTPPARRSATRVLRNRART